MTEESYTETYLFRFGSFKWKSVSTDTARSSSDRSNGNHSLPTGGGREGGEGEGGRGRGDRKGVEGRVTALYKNIPLILLHITRMVTLPLRSSCLR